MAPIPRLRQSHQRKSLGKTAPVKATRGKKMLRHLDILPTRFQGPYRRSSNVMQFFPQSLPTYLIRNFLTAIVKLFSTRRNPDAAQKQQILDSASSVADVLLKHLEPIRSGE